MEISSIQKSLATKALYCQEHRFNDLYRFARDGRWLEQAYVNIRGNKGFRTPGVDGISGKDLSDTDWQQLIAETQEQLRGGKYTPQPVRRVYIPKANGKLRPLGIPTIQDRLVQEVLRMVLEPIYESRFLDCSHGFRPGRSTMTAIDRLQYMSGVHTYYWVVEGDIRGCFDNIPHDRLIHVLRQVIKDERLLSLIWSFLKAGYQEDGQVFQPKTGTPQGGIVSPLLANIYLHEMDKVWHQRYGSLSHKRRHTRRRKGLANYDLIRYADDFLLLSNGRKASAEAIRNEFTEVLADLGLTLSPEKTLVTHVDDGLEFLGFHIQRKPQRGNPQRKRLYTTATDRNVKRYRDRIREILATTHGDPVNKIRAVNRAVRGWANYYRHVQSSHIRQRLDHWTYMAVWRWLARKHGGSMPRKQLYAKYIQTNAKGRKVLGYKAVHLARMNDVGFQRYYSPKGGYQNPYLTPASERPNDQTDDPLPNESWDGTSTQKGFALIRQDLLAQLGPVCHNCLRKFKPWQLHTHHLVAQKDNGKDKRDNLVLVCYRCHPRTDNYGSK